MIKEQIINTAFDLFSQYGIKSVSMDDVAKAAGISKRTLYESFEDKETLLIEGIDHNSESYNPQNHPSTFSKRSVSILRFFSKTKRLF